MRKFRIEVNGKVYEVKVEEITSSAPATVAVADRPQIVRTPKPFETLKLEPPKVEVKPITRVEEKAAPPPPKDGGITSPMQGTIVQVKVKAGDAVKKGDVIAVVEAMKMENDVRSHRSGVVKSVHVNIGQTVSPGTLLAMVE